MMATEPVTHIEHIDDGALTSAVLAGVKGSGVRATRSEICASLTFAFRALRIGFSESLSESEFPDYQRLMSIVLDTYPDPAVGDLAGRASILAEKQ